MGRDDTPWRLVPRLLLRRAGFDFDLLESLTDPSVTVPAERYRATVRELETVRERLLSGSLPAAVAASRKRADRAALRALSKARAAVGRRRALPAGLCAASPRGARLEDYRAAHTAMLRADAELRTAIEQDLSERTIRLRKALEPPVLDALLRLAPSFYDGTQRWLAGEATGSARDRAMARRLYLHVQRLAGENETTSSFGPLVHGLVDPGISDVVFGPPTETGVVETRPFLAFWAVCELARRMASDPAVRPGVPVTWVPAGLLQDRDLALADGRRVRLTDDQARLLAAVDGTRSPDALADCTGLRAADVTEWLARFELLGVVRCWPEPASTAVQPFEQLLADAGRLSAHTPWPDRLAALWACVERFAAAPGHEPRRAALEELEREFTALTGAPARRSGGETHADRLIVHLESRGDLGPVRLGTTPAAVIEAELAPVLDFGALHGELLHAAHQRLAVSVLRAHGTERLRCDEFGRLVRDAVARGALRDELRPAGKLTASLARLVEARTHGGECELSPTDLRGLGVPSGRARFAGPDVLIRQVGADRSFVLGEVHPYVFAWGPQGLFGTDPQEPHPEFAADLPPRGGPGGPVTVVRHRRHREPVTESFPGRLIEVTAVAGRDRERTVAITDLFVEAHEGRVRLRDARGEVVLYAGEDDHPHLMPFSPPPVSRFPLVRSGDRAPRITVGRVTVQRAAWWLHPAELTGALPARGSGGKSFRSVQRARALHGLPRWVFAQVAGEPMPMCVDLDSPLAVEALAAVVAGDATRKQVCLREMLPEPEALWLRRQGRPVTSHLRLAMVRRAS